MENEKLICPLRAIIQGGAAGLKTKAMYCTDACAWWDDPNSQCCMMTIAGKISTLALIAEVKEVAHGK